MLTQSESSEVCVFGHDNSLTFSGFNTSNISSLNADTDTEEPEESESQLFVPIKVRKFSELQEYDVFLGIVQRSKR